MEEIYILTEETEDGNSIVNGFKTKENAIKEMGWMAERAKNELYDEELEPIIEKEDDSFYVTNGTGKFYFYKVLTIELKP